MLLLRTLSILLTITQNIFKNRKTMLIKILIKFNMV